MQAAQLFKGWHGQYRGDRGEWRRVNRAGHSHLPQQCAGSLVRDDVRGIVSIPTVGQAKPLPAINKKFFLKSSKVGSPTTLPLRERFGT